MSGKGESEDTSPTSIAPAGAALVIVVDDERLIADTLAAILRNAGYEAKATYDASGALALAARTPPDLLITDVCMPGMSGVELAITVKQAIPHCRVLLFSGHATLVDLLAPARAAGYNFTVLAKPVHPADLLATIADDAA
jgi:DNA-binding NtrC family response regulator